MQLLPPITSRTNARVKALRASFSGKAAQPGELVGIEGENLIGEARRSGMVLETFYLREGSERVLEAAIFADIETSHWVVLSANVFDSAVGTISPQGIAATWSIAPVVTADLSNRSTTLLVLEDIQDPGNLGTLIRSAEAFGVTQIFVTPGTANEWSPKVMRASAGSVFRVPIVREPLEGVKKKLMEHDIRVCAAVAQADGATSILRARLQPPCALMIGNEGRGLSHAALALADELVNIPCGIESLNAAVAGSTLMFEAFRQRGGLR